MGNKKVLAIIGSIILIGVVIFAFILNDKPEPDCCSENKDKINTQLPIKGTDNNLEFTVTQVTCSKESLGDEIVYKTPEGQFCLAFVQVKNNSNEDLQLFSEDQLIVLSNGEKIAVNTETQYYVQNGYWYDSIPAQDFASGTLAWDIPENETIKEFIFHEGIDSEGITLKYN